MMPNRPAPIHARGPGGGLQLAAGLGITAGAIAFVLFWMWP